jgi:hypothetical protein
MTRVQGYPSDGPAVGSAFHMSDTASTYDVAVSFLALDEPRAVELAETVAGRLRAFVYSERQRELAGREGMSEFTRVFERDSRIVVVLHRQGWGQTPWTGVEQTAIQERGFRKGWDFLVFVPLDESPAPDWLPKTRIWLNFSRFGMAGLAAVIEQRFQDAGGSPTVETAIDLAARLRKEQDAEAMRAHFLATQEGINLAEAEVSVLFDEIQRLVGEVTATISIALDRRGTEAVWLYRAGHTLSAHWHREWANTLSDSQLTLARHRGRVGPGMYANRSKPELVSEEPLHFNVDALRLPFWETRNHPHRRFSSRTLADEIVQQVLRTQDTK